MTIAFVFPGQGSQSKGMLSEYAGNGIVDETFQEASGVLGYDLWKLIQENPEDKLNQTEYTQPALLVASVALFRLYKTNNEKMPILLAGHSLGEYTALVCAEALSFKDAVKLVEMRGRFMQEAVKEGEGAMAAILGLEDSVVEQICEEVSNHEMVAPANYNSPKQIVIAGGAKAVDNAIEKAKLKGAKRAIKLSVSVPSHCELMKSAALKLKEILIEIPMNRPNIPVLQNVDAKAHENIENIRHALIEQLYRPVRWVDIIKTMVALKVTSIVECGPGKVLSGLNKRIAPTLNCEAVCL